MTRRILAAEMVMVALAAAAVYANALSNGFVSDDLYVTLNNPSIRSLDSIPGFFVTSFWPDNQTPNYYRPLPNVVSTVAYAAFGLSPSGHHLINVAWHVAASLLAFLLARRLLQRQSDAFTSRLPLFVALVFATHPIHTEAVTWVAGLPDVTCATLLLLAMLLHIHATSGAKYAYGLSAVAFFLAALCKETALVLPVIIVCHDWTTTSKGLPRPSLTRYLPLAIAATTYTALRVNALGGFAPAGPATTLQFGSTVAKSFVLFPKYLAALLAPVNLNAIHTPLGDIHFTDMNALIGIAVAVLFITVATFATARRSVVLTALAFISAPLLPVLYRPWLNGSDFGERYLYLPCFGFALLLAIGIRLAGTTGARRTLAPLAVALLTAYSYGTVMRNKVWRDDYALYTDVASKSPTLPEPHMFVGYRLFGEGRTDEARTHFRKAMIVNEEYSRKVLSTLSGLGNEYVRSGNADEAIRHYQLAIELDPRFADGYANIGVVHAQEGRLDEAIRAFESALALEPEDMISRRNLELARQQLASSGIPAALVR